MIISLICASQESIKVSADAMTDAKELMKYSIKNDIE